MAISEEAQIARSRDAQAIHSREFPRAKEAGKSQQLGRNRGSRPAPCGFPERTGTRLPGPALSYPPGPGPARRGTALFSMRQIWRGGVQQPAGRLRPARFRAVRRTGVPGSASGSLARRGVPQRRSPILPRREPPLHPLEGGDSSRSLLPLSRVGEGMCD